MTNTNFFNQTRSFSNRNVSVVSGRAGAGLLRDYEREQLGGERGGAKSELSLILFMPLTAWKERRITCQLGCSDPFCDLTSAHNNSLPPPVF
jgi:hypothetical protein